MDQRLAMIADWLRDEWTMTELAERYGISRKVACKWVARDEVSSDGTGRDDDTAPAATAAAQQPGFERMRQAFNRERPHEALGQQPPARHYVPSPRPYPARLEDPWYDATHQVRRVKAMARSNGRVSTSFYQ